MIIFRLSLFFSVFLCACAYSAPYQHYIASITEDGGKITLDDGFTWEIIVPLLFGEDDRAKVKQWNVGDEVALQIDVQYGILDFDLKNLRTMTTAWVKYGPQNVGWDSLFIVDMDSKGHMTLSDGSRWESWDLYATDSWKKGDRVLVYRYKLYKNYYTLVNPDLGLQLAQSWWDDIPYDLSSAYATLLE